MPHDCYVDLRAIVGRLRRLGVRPILAHPERCEALLHEPGSVEELVRAGCLVQVSSASITDPHNARDRRTLKSWFKRGVVHLLGSDGHSLIRRPPHMAAAYQQIARWIGNVAADRIGSTIGMAVLQGLPLHISQPEPKRSAWGLKFW
jgi:protein-tyrosine phosphatase